MGCMHLLGTVHRTELWHALNTAIFIFCSMLMLMQYFLSQQPLKTQLCKDMTSLEEMEHDAVWKLTCHKLVAHLVYM